MAVSESLKVNFHTESINEKLWILEIEIKKSKS